jgi:hypothetical protein
MSKRVFRIYESDYVLNDHYTYQDREPDQVADEDKWRFANQRLAALTRGQPVSDAAHCAASDECPEAGEE